MSALLSQRQTLFGQALCEIEIYAPCMKCLCCKISQAVSAACAMTFSQNAVVKAGSMNKAALLLNTTQPAVSRSIGEERKL